MSALEQTRSGCDPLNGRTGDAPLFIHQLEKTDMGKLLFKASDGDRFDILRVSEDIIENEHRQVSEMPVLIR